jgi:hypothetical protein
MKYNIQSDATGQPIGDLWSPIPAEVLLIDGSPPDEFIERARSITSIVGVEQGTPFLMAADALAATAAIVK